MAQWLRTLAVFIKDPGSIPSTYIVAHKRLYVILVSGDPTPSSVLQAPGIAHGTQTHMF